MVRTYLKYEHSSAFGTVVSAQSDSIWTPDVQTTTTGRSTGAGRAIVGANEDVLSWDVKKGELLSRWHVRDSTAQVTALARSKTDSDIFAVGYSDGTVRLWDATTALILVTFNGHRSDVTQLAFDPAGIRLASGSKDTDIIVWDLVAETGLFKLRGHKGPVTGLHFIQSPLVAVDGINGDSVAVNGESSASFLLSTSKDAMIKFWDVSSQYCLETHVTQSNGECWSLGVMADEYGCITGGNDGELKVWTLDLEALGRVSQSVSRQTQEKILNERGILVRQAKDRTTGIQFHPKSDYFVAHGVDKAAEVWRIRSPSEVQKSLARKRRRKREKEATKKAGEAKEDIEMTDGDAEQDDLSIAGVAELFVLHTIVRTGGKVRSANWAGGRPSKSLQLLISTSNNQIELYELSTKQPKRKQDAADEPPDYNRIHSVDLPGHRTDVRAIALSSDDRMLASASHGSLKIWNIATKSCLRTLDCGYALCCAFLPGDKIVVVGNKAGELELFDIASSSLIDTVAAHENAIWSLSVHPDGRSLATGSGDKTVKFWNLTIIQEEIPGTRRTTPRLGLAHKRTLKLDDDVLSICYTPDSRLIAVATLDTTVKVFFADTLKLFLTLYGHKLPVLHIAIATDSKLLATCSADKNIRLWGLDFGDCHKALFAHDAPITGIAFIPHPLNAKDDAHFLFSAARDGQLKTWDGDRFAHAQTLKAHAGDVLALAVARTGDFAVSAARDGSLRVWSLADEPLFLEEERERELEELYDANLAERMQRDEQDALVLNPGAEDAGAVVAPTKQTAASLTAGEKIAEALAVSTADLDDARAQPDGAARQRHPVLAFGGKTAQAHLLDTLRAVPLSHLQDALLLLPLSVLPALFMFLAIFLRENMDLQMSCRVLFFLLKTHHTQIVAAGKRSELGQRLEEIRVEMRRRLEEEKEVLGFNLAGLGVLCERAGRMGTASMRIEDLEAEMDGQKGRRAMKREFISIR